MKQGSNSGTEFEGNIRTKSANGRGMSVIYPLSRYLPAVLLGLFAVLFFLFYLAPAVVVPKANSMGGSISSRSYGNLYKIPSMVLSVVDLSTLSGCVDALIAFAAILAVYAVASIFVLWKTNFKLKPYMILSIGACVLYFALLLGGSILIGQIVELGDGPALMAAGPAPILTVVFSCILIIITAAAVGVRVYFEKKCPEFMEAYNAAHEARRVK